MPSFLKKILPIFILTIAISTQYQIPTTLAQESPVATDRIQTSNTGIPDAPVITSSTHPDQNKWYSSSEVNLSWNLASGVTDSQILIGKLPKGQPKVLYASPVNSKKLTLGDGTWYFHVRVKNNSGWSDTTDFKIQIDTDNPTDLVVEQQPSESTPTFSISANDTLSGIDHYKITLDDNPAIEWRPVDDNKFSVPSIFPGDHILKISALDHAGNNIEAIREFSTSELLPPHLNKIESPQNSDEKIAISGSTYPETQVTIWLKKSNGTVSSRVLRSSKDGAFTLNYNDGLSAGTYTVSAEIITPNGINKSSDEQALEVTGGVVEGEKQSEKKLVFNSKYIPLALSLILIALITAILKILPRGIKKLLERSEKKPTIKKELGRLSTTFNDIEKEIVAKIEQTSVRLDNNKAPHKKRRRRRSKKNFKKK